MRMILKDAPMIKLHEKGHDYFGRHWNIKVGKQSGIVVRTFSNIRLVFGVDFVRRLDEDYEGGYISFFLGPVEITIYSKTYWE